MVHAVYVSGLPTGAKLVEVAQAVCICVDWNKKIQWVVHNETAFFLLCGDRQTGELIIQKWQGKPVYQGAGQVSWLNAELEQTLMKLKPELFGATGVSQSSTNTEPVQPKVALQLSDVLDAIANWTPQQKQQLGVALGFNPVGPGNSAGTSYGQQPSSQAGPALSKPPPGVYSTPSMPLGSQPHQYQTPVQQTLPQPMFTASPHAGQSFQFGSSNTINNIRVSTFSGSNKECSFEQFRHDVQCLLKQGCPDVMVLNAIKRSIKGQAQEIVLHMGEDATVADILSRYEIMFGDVNPPHVLLAQFYAAAQAPGETMTDWYSRLEDLASRITRKDTNVISPNNYDILVNTQFWTKLHSEQMRNALRHKFDTLAQSPQFIVEARKIESEFSSHDVRVNHLNTEISSAIQQGFDKIHSRLTALERRVESHSNPSGASKAPTPSSRPEKNSGNGQRKSIICYKCQQPGHIAKKCALNSQRSGQGSGPTSH